MVTQMIGSRQPTAAFLVCNTTLIALFVVLNTSPALAAPGRVAKQCHAFWFPGYQSSKLASLNDLPAPIRDKVSRHLETRLGGAFTSRLEFVGGQVVDDSEYRRAKPDASPSPFAFELQFRVMFQSDGSVEYCSQVRLDAKGEVVDEIDLPAISLQPGKAEVKSVEQVVRVAESLGVPVDRSELAINYNKVSGSLEYRVTYQTRGPDQKCTSVHLRLSAHDLGKIAWSTTDCPVA